MVDVDMLARDPRPRKPKFSEFDFPCICGSSFWTDIRREKHIAKFDKKPAAKSHGIPQR